MTDTQLLGIVGNMRLFNDINTERKVGTIFLAFLFITPFLMAGYVMANINEKNNKTITTVERGFQDGMDYSIFIDKTTGKRYIRSGGEVTALNDK